jgi:HAD superfamily hydrolase (TIGR01490 family)
VSLPADQRPVVAAFDFDGTVTDRDSMFPFLRYAAGHTKYYWRIASQLPTLVGYLMGRVDNNTAKERVLTRFFAGVPVEALNTIGNRFAEQVLPGMVRSSAMERLAWHKASGHRCVLISASLQLYLQPWAHRAGFDAVIGSQFELRGGRYITGRLADGNCHGAEKVRRLLAMMGERDSFRLYAYGDSRGDRELLECADRAYYRAMPPPGEEG